MLQSVCVCVYSWHYYLSIDVISLSLLKWPLNFIDARDIYYSIVCTYSFLLHSTICLDDVIWFFIVMNMIMDCRACAVCHVEQSASDALHFVLYMNELNYISRFVFGTVGRHTSAWHFIYHLLRDTLPKSAHSNVIPTLYALYAIRN